jgi:hypothetical protein
MSVEAISTHRALLDLLGARWALDAPVVGAAWEAGGRLAAFGLGDGTVALARAAWQGGPAVGPRAGGGVELIPATAPPPPVMRAGVHRGACLGLVADTSDGFLSGGDDGRFARVATDGAIEVLAEYPGGWADPVAAGPGGWRACAVRRTVHRSGPVPGRLDVPSSVAALAFDPTGRHLAIGHYNGVTVWSADADQPRLLPWRGLHRAVAWSPDGTYLVSGMQENALHGWRLADGGDIEMGGYPGQPRSLSFAANGRFLATSGGPRVVCWRFDPPGRDAGPTECGVPSQVPVTRVACHPLRPLVAAGYHNGAVLLCQPGSSDLLFVRGSGGGAVTALAWSKDGASLALGTESGEVGLVGFPEQFFRLRPDDTVGQPMREVAR